MRNGQSGISIMGLIAGFVVLIFLALFGMKVIPSYLEFRSAKSAIEVVAKQAQSPADVRRGFDSRATIDDITSIKSADLDIQKEGNQIVIAFAYEKRIPLFGPVSLVIDYAADSKGGQ
jgi:hypothetical protein